MRILAVANKFSTTYKLLNHSQKLYLFITSPCSQKMLQSNSLTSVQKHKIRRISCKLWKRPSNISCRWLGGRGCLTNLASRSSSRWSLPFRGLWCSSLDRFVLCILLILTIEYLILQNRPIKYIVVMKHFSNKQIPK
jgi:hypothetical protein